MKSTKGEMVFDPSRGTQMQNNILRGCGGNNNRTHDYRLEYALGGSKPTADWLVYRCKNCGKAIRQ